MDQSARHHRQLDSEQRLLRFALFAEREPTGPEQPRRTPREQLNAEIDRYLERRARQNREDGAEDIPYATPARDPELYPHPDSSRRTDVQDLKKVWWGRPFLSLLRSSRLSLEQSAADRMGNLIERLYQKVDKTRYEVLRSADRTSRDLLQLFYKRDLIQKTIDELERGMGRIKRHSEGLKDELDGQYRRVRIPDEKYLTDTHSKRIEELRTLLAGVEEQITKAIGDTDGLRDVERDHKELVRLLTLGGMTEQDAETMARENALGRINLEREMNRHRVMLTGGRAEWNEVLRLGTSLRMRGTRFFQRFAGRETKDRRQSVRTFYVLMVDPSIEREWGEWLRQAQHIPTQQDRATPSELQRETSPDGAEPPMGMAA